MATKAFLLENGVTMNVIYEPSVLTGIRERFHTRAEVRNWLEGKQTASLVVSESEFLHLARKVIDSDREFLEEIGRL